MPIPRVLTSYVHENEEHKEKVLKFCDKLVYDGIDCWCDRYVTGTPERGWPNWMYEQVKNSDFVLVVCTETYLKRWEGNEADGTGKGAKFESTLIIGHYYASDSKSKKFIPIVFSKDDIKFIPEPLNSYTHYNVSNEDEYQNLYRVLTNQIEIQRPKIGKIKNLKSAVNLNEFQELEQVDSENTVVTSSNKVKSINENKVPLIPEITEDMKPGLKLVQAFFAMTISERYKIAEDLDLTEGNEDIENGDNEEVSTKFLLRAKSKNKLSALWSILFDEAINPNPYK